MTDVRVGIVSWNTADLLDRCLRALPAALGDLDAEVVVVDNASDDGSAAVADRHGVTVVRNPDNRGYARAMNQALGATEAPVLVALNPDTEPPAGSLAALVERLDRHPEVALVVPRLVHDDGRLQHSVYRFPSVAVTAIVSLVPRRFQRGAIGRRWWLEGAAPHDRSGPVDWAIGAVHVLRAAAVAPGPPYSERWFMYVEDLELCWRLRQHGWGVFLDADVTIPHVGNAAGEQAWGQSRSRRFWEASYDFHALARGRAAARRWAAANTAGASIHVLVHAARWLWSGRRAGGSRAAARDLLGLLPVHARAAWRPPSPSGPGYGSRPQGCTTAPTPGDTGPAPRRTTNGASMGGDPLARHRADAPRILAEGDPDAIKRLYVDLGDDFWDALADADADVPLLSLPQTHPVVAAQVDASADVVLDAGCGPNPALSLALARSGSRTVVALDIGLGTVRLARRVGQQHGVELLGVVGDVEALPFRDGAFDAVVCDDTIEHLPDDRRGATELARVSRADAAVVLATPNRHSLAVIRRKVADRLRRVQRPAAAYYTSNSHLREYTWPELERLVEPSLRVRRRVGVPFPVGGWKARLVNRVVRRRPWHRLSPMIVLVTEPRGRAAPPGATPGASRR